MALYPQFWGNLNTSPTKATLNFQFAFSAGALFQSVFVYIDLIAVYIHVMFKLFPYYENLITLCLGKFMKNLYMSFKIILLIKAIFNGIAVKH